MTFIDEIEERADSGLWALHYGLHEHARADIPRLLRIAKAARFMDGHAVGCGPTIAPGMPLHGDGCSCGFDELQAALRGDDEQVEGE